MAGALRSKEPVLLGFVDEEIHEDESSSLDYTVSKIGGQPVRKTL